MFNYLVGIVAILIILALAAYAISLLRRLKKQNNAILQAKIDRAKRLKESIVIIAKAMQNADCNLSEGVIRLHGLIAPLGQYFSNYSSMSQLYEVVKEMPTHELRRELAKKERMRLDLTREAAEAEFEKAILLELNQLLIDVENFGEY